MNRDHEHPLVRNARASTHTHTHTSSIDMSMLEEWFNKEENKWGISSPWFHLPLPRHANMVEASDMHVWIWELRKLFALMTTKSEDRHMCSSQSITITFHPIKWGIFDHHHAWLHLPWWDITRHKHAWRLEHENRHVWVCNEHIYKSIDLFDYKPKVQPNIPQIKWETYSANIACLD